MFDLNVDGDGIFINEINKWFDLALLWFILWAWLRWTILLAGIVLGIGLAIFMFIIFLYNKSLS